MRKMVVIFTVLGCLGCSASAQKEGISPSVNKNIQLKSVTKEHNLDSLENKPQRKWLFNGEEFYVQGRAITTGANVYNNTLAQYGVVQDHIFVTLSPEGTKESLSALLEGKNLKSTTRTGNAIYKVTFPAGTEIFSVYKILDNSKSIKSVEIGVFYNGSNKAEY